MPNENTGPPQSLPPLTAAEKALVERFPLPGGTPDAIVNKKLLALALDVSATTIDTWLVGGLPYQTKGTNGSAYEFRLSVAFAWRQQREAAEDADRRFSEDAVAQLRLNLLGGSAADRARATLSPKEQKEALAAEREFMIAARLRRDLIPAQEVAEGFEVSFAAIRDGFDAAPDRLARELNLPPAAVEAVQAILDDILRDAQARIEGIMEGS